MNKKLVSAPERKQKGKRWLRGILGFVVAALLLSAATSWLSLRNPFTASGYEGWKEATVPGLRPFMLPEEWRLTWIADDPDGQRLLLTLADASGAEIARGYAFPVGLTAASFTDIASEFAGASLSEYRLWDQIAVGMGSKAAAFRQAMFFSSDKKLLDTYVLELYNAPAEMHLWFPYCEGAEADALAEQMKGLISSYLD